MVAAWTEAPVDRLRKLQGIQVHRVWPAFTGEALRTSRTTSAAPQSAPWILPVKRTGGATRQYTARELDYERRTAVVTCDCKQRKVPLGGVRGGLDLIGPIPEADPLKHCNHNVRAGSSVGRAFDF